MEEDKVLVLNSSLRFDSVILHHSLFSPSAKRVKLMCGRFLIEVGVFFKFPDFLFAESLTVSVSHCFVCFFKTRVTVKAATIN